LADLEAKYLEELKAEEATVNNLNEDIKKERKELADELVKIS
jgi:hypothetical protein